MRPVTKTVCRVVATQATAGATNSAAVDCLGYDYANITITLQGVEATTAPAVIKLQQSYDTNASNFADVTGFIGGTSFTLPTTMRSIGATGGPTVVKMCVDRRAMKRYLRVPVSVGTHALVFQQVDLSLGDEGPFTAAAQGVDVLVTG